MINIIAHIVVLVNAKRIFCAKGVARGGTIAALEWYKTSAEQGDLKAQETLEKYRSPETGVKIIEKEQAL